MSKEIIKVHLILFLHLILLSSARGQVVDSSCTYWFNEEWKRQDAYDSASNSTWTYFSHYFPDSTYNVYLDFDKNGTKYLDTAYIWLKRYHYDLYKNISPSVLDSLFQETRIKIETDSSINPKKFYRLFREFVASIGDGHTTTLFRDYDYYLEHRGHMLPFSVKIHNDNILVDEIHSDDTILHNGNQILEINGISASDLLNQFYKLAFADLERPEFKRKGVEGSFNSLLWTILDKSSPCYILKVQRSFLDTVAVTVKGITIAGDGPLTEYNPASDVFFAMHENRKVALLGLPTLLFDGEKRKFRKKIRKSFQMMRKKSIDTLIIDIMDNVGGTCDNFLYLMKYLIPRDSVMEMKIEGKAAEKEIKKHGEYYCFQEYRERGVRKNQRFTGTAILLINNRTFSAAGDFADYFKAYKVGPVVGYTHSNVNNFGSPVRFSLSDIYIDLYIPRAKFISPSWIEKGSSPDLEIRPTDYLDVLKDEWVVEWWW